MWEAFCQSLKAKKGDGVRKQFWVGCPYVETMELWTWTWGFPASVSSSEREEGSVYLIKYRA